MGVRIGINGFGRIGRNFFRAMLANPDAGLELVAVNDLGDAAVFAHLLKYDSVLGPLAHDVKATEDGIAVDGQSFQWVSEPEPAKLPWQELGVQIVFESTGRNTARAAAAKHLDAGAKKVIISAPSDDADATFCVGVNHETYDASKHHVISNASCTTNCLAPMARILHDTFGIERGLMTTVHAYTTENVLLDFYQPTRSGKPDVRRMRAAGLNIIPSSTGAARAIGQVVPEMKGKLNGMAFRVPVPDGSVTDFVAQVKGNPSTADVNAAFRDAAGSARWQRVLEYTEAPLVSQDIVGNSHSCVFSAGDTLVNEGLVKVIGWYDNEWGYSNRLVDLCAHLERAGL
jgi:glyceraldehyde 3-phosphate dehydrogenase